MTSNEARENVKSKEYIRPMPVTWFLRNHYLVSYAIRELTSVFVAGYAIFLMVVLAFQNEGRAAFGIFFRSILESPASLVLHLIVLTFVVFHSATSFNGMGRVMVIRRGEERVSPALIAEANYGLWIIVSALIFIGVILWSDAFERSMGN
jgi:fumarate reductase subunit C